MSVNNNIVQVSTTIGEPRSACRHPSLFEAPTVIPVGTLCVFGAIIGMQLIATVGVATNTALIGALVAMILARIPLQIFVRYRSIHVQNLAQSAISAATYGAASGLFVPIGIPYALGQPNLIMPMFLGASLAMVVAGKVSGMMLGPPG